MFWTRDAVGGEARRRGTDIEVVAWCGEGTWGREEERTARPGGGHRPPDTRAAARGRVSEASDESLAQTVPGSLARGRR
jgi:hypothetical protein